MLASLVFNALLAVSSVAFASGAGASAGASTAASLAPARATLATPQFRRYGVTDGLPSGAVYSVAQDHHGMMWFGAAGGLMRFDGVSFKVFRHVMGDPLSIPASQTYALFVDRDDRIWAGGVSTGLIAYDQRSGRFRHWMHDDAQAASLSSNEVWSIAQTPDGSLWVATQHGLDRMRADRAGFDHVPLQLAGAPAHSFGTVRALLAEADGRLWIGAESGLYLRLPDGSVQQVPVDPAFHGDIGKAWHIDGGHGEVRVAVTGGLLVIGADGVARPLADAQLSSLRILSSARDRQGRLWLGSLTGVLLEDRPGHLQQITGQPLLPGGLPSDRIWQVMRDREGGLWFTLDQSSIAYLPPDWNGFTHFTHVPDDPASLSGIAALSILNARDGRLWVGGFNGWVDRLDPRSGQVQHVVQGLRGNMAALAEDARGRLWIAGPGRIYRYDHGKLITLDAEKTGITRPVALCIGEDGRLYVSSWGEGAFAIDTDSLAVTPLLPADAPADARDPDQLTFHAGRLWYASEGGLLRGDGPGQALAFVAGVPRGEVLAFAFDTEGFWTATAQKIEHYREIDGRAQRDDSVDISQMAFAPDLMAMQVDRQGRLWLFANPGLWRFDPHTRHFTAFGPSQGLANAYFTNGATGAAADGTLYAANSGGVIAFQPAQLATPEQPGPVPLLSLSGISVRRDGRVQALDPDHRPVQLQWRDRDLHVQTRVASFVDPAANRYRFRLQGFDTGWVDVGSHGEREFAGLAAGTYTLDVQAADANGQWGRLFAPIAIRVQAPPWVRWWAWLAYVLLATIATGLVLRSWRRRLAQRHRMQLVEQQRQMAEAASAAKTQFLATLSHEIRTPMTGVMGMAELLLSTPLNPLQHDYTQAMQRSGGMLMKLLNDALDLARIEAGRLELEPAPFDPRRLLDDVAQLEQGLAHAKGIRFVLEVAADLPPQLVGDAVRIKQVLLNLANNALKFTDHGCVTLRAQRVTDGVLFSVSDTGPGIPEASQARLFQRFEQEDGPQRRAGSGLGLAICRELVDMMEGSIELESRLGHGSTFRVRLSLPEPPTAAPAPAPEMPGGVRQLLLVEDDTIVAAVIRGLLERQGHSVCHVANGLAALAELAHANFDAVLLDLDLPGVDGFQIARLIRQREQAGQHLPIVAVTARSGGDDEARARAAGMDGFLHKPLTGEQLAAALAQVMASTVMVDDPV